MWLSGSTGASALSTSALGTDRTSLDQRSDRRRPAVWLTPDPASRSGHSVRVVGYSRTANQVLTVILVDPGIDPSERPEGDWWGSNAWVASQRDRQLYGKEDP